MSSSSGGGGVQVIHEGTVGPYETATLSATDPAALANWLNTNGYVLPEDMKATVQAYVEEGFDFIALKLAPGKGVQTMTPVRVVSQGAGYSLPLRMVAAGAAANVDLVLYVIGEGRYETANFNNVVLPPALISWDFKLDSSDYGKVRLSALRSADGTNWLTSYAASQTLIQPVDDPFTMGVAQYTTDGGSANTIADAYFLQGYANDEVSSIAGCIGKLDAYASSMAVVTDLCDDNGENCATPGPAQIDQRELGCDGLDDIAVAMTGLHPADVFLTRLEASLPREALNQDLLLQAASAQGAVSNRFTAGVKLNACWDSEPAAIVTEGDNSRRLPPGGVVMLLVGAAGLLLLVRREQRRAVALGS